MGFLLRHGNDTLYAEMVQDTARRQGKLEQGQLYVASISFSGNELERRAGTAAHV